MVSLPFVSRSCVCARANLEPTKGLTLALPFRFPFLSLLSCSFPQVNRMPSPPGMQGTWNPYCPQPQPHHTATIPTALPPQERGRGREAYEAKAPQVKEEERKGPKDEELEDVTKEETPHREWSDIEDAMLLTAVQVSDPPYRLYHRDCSSFLVMLVLISIQVLPSIELIKKTGCRLTKRFSMAEIRARWQAILYDPLTAAYLPFASLSLPYQTDWS